VSDPQLRPVRPEDLPALRELFTVTRRETFHWMDPAVYQPDDFDEQTTGEGMLVAELDGAIAGFIAWWAPQNFIHHLYIAREFQRRGVGTALLDACLARIGRPTRLKCVIKNENATRFYLSHGWKAVETGDDAEGGYRLLELA